MEEPNLAAPSFLWIFLPTVFAHLFNIGYNLVILVPDVLASTQNIIAITTYVLYVTFSGLGVAEIGILAANLVETVEECEHLGDTTAGFKHIKAGCFPKNSAARVL